jgi:DNA-binding MarR family transcriptional regulator
MHAAVGVVAEQSGLTLRGHIVMSALHKVSGLTQIELGQVLGMDKSTLAVEIDRLEKAGYVGRQPDPRDRRARIPVLTAKGSTLRAQIAARAGAVEDDVLSAFPASQVARFREMLYAIIGSAEDPGSCL